ncbi:MAG: glucosyltransferase domain-containing protein [Butyrivibrio sp.]|nr:glucosyltransferase domain-containing protein [Butyrivibrio sp.]
MLKKLSSYKYEFGILIIIGLVAYSGYIINVIPNPDAIWNGLYYKSSYKWEIALGRFMVGIWQVIFGNAVVPSLTAILSIILSALSGTMISAIFNIRNKVLTIIIGLIIMFSPHMLSGMTYYYCFIYYMIAQALMILAVWLITEHKYVLGICAIVISLGTYQAYLQVLLIVGLLYVFFSISERGLYKNADENKSGIQFVIKDILVYVFVVLIGIIFYLIVNKIVLMATGVEADSGRGFSSMGILGIKQILCGIISCYKEFANYFVGTELVNNEYVVLFIQRRFINIAVFILGIVLLVIYLKKSNSFLNRCICIFLTLLVPVCAMAMVIVAPGVSIYDTTGALVLAAMNYVFLIPVIILDRLGDMSLYGVLSEKLSNRDSSNILLKENIFLKSNKIFNYIGICILFLFIVMNVQMTFHAESYLKASYNKTYTVASKISSEIDEVIGSSETDSKKIKVPTVCIIGNMEAGNYPELKKNLLSSISWTVPSYGCIWDDVNGAQATWIFTFKEFLGIKYKRCDIDTYQVLAVNEQVQNMPLFPQAGSVQMIDGVVVVKLSE